MISQQNSSDSFENESDINCDNAAFVSFKLYGNDIIITVSGYSCNFIIYWLIFNMQCSQSSVVMFECHCSETANNNQTFPASDSKV